MFHSKTTIQTMNEECWLLTGYRGRWAWAARYDRYSVGQPARVAFDSDYVWENRGRLVGFIHTHPSFPATPSITDDVTMMGQVGSLGRPLLCCIDGTDGLRAWWYMDDESAPVEARVLRIGKKIYGRTP